MPHYCPACRQEATYIGYGSAFNRTEWRCEACKLTFYIESIDLRVEKFSGSRQEQT